jgi:transmembrane sensor
MTRRARKQASRWLLLLQGEAVSAADRSAFEAWYRADPDHAAEFDTLTTTVDRLRKLRTRIAADPVPSPPVLERSRRSVLTAAAGGALAASVVGFAWVAVSAPRTGEKLIFQTAIGEQRKVTLADGSHIELNTNTRLVVQMSSKRRHVALQRGEAMFDVAHEAQRPFEVEASGYVLRAVGTEFIVRTDESAAGLTVIEGAVTVAPSSGGTSQLIKGSERFDLARGVRAAPLGEKEIERVLAWRRGLLEFDGAPLRDIVAEVERYTGARFTFADPALADLSMVTYFRAADLRGFLARLERSYPLLSSRPTPEGYLIYQRPEAAR